MVGYKYLSKISRLLIPWLETHKLYLVENEWCSMSYDNDAWRSRGGELPRGCKQMFMYTHAHVLTRTYTHAHKNMISLIYTPSPLISRTYANAHNNKSACFVLCFLAAYVCPSRPFYALILFSHYIVFSGISQGLFWCIICENWSKTDVVRE